MNRKWFLLQICELATNDFNHGMVFGAKWAGFGISETAESVMHTISQLFKSILPSQIERVQAHVLDIYG